MNRYEFTVNLGPNRGGVIFAEAIGYNASQARNAVKAQYPQAQSVVLRRTVEQGKR